MESLFVTNYFAKWISILCKKIRELIFYSDDGDHVGMVYVGGTSNYNYIELRFKDKPPAANMDIIRMPVISWITDEPFPDRLP